MTGHEKCLRLREFLSSPGGMIALGVTDRFFARLAEDCGYSLIHLTGNGMHKSLMLPDRGLVTMTEMAQRAAEIGDTTRIPLIVDGETGYGGPDQTARAVQLFERAGVAAVRFEDRLLEESVSGSTGKVRAISIPEMTRKIKAAVDARQDSSLVLVVRCDARPTESLNEVQERLAAYVEAGADALGVQLSDLEESRFIASHSPAPLVGLWPRREQITVFEFLARGYKIVQVPQSIMLAAATAVREMLLELKEKGTDREYFARIAASEWGSRWYSNLGTETKGKN